MRDLEKYGVVELKQEELVEVEGGWWFQALRVIAVAAAAIHELVHDDVCGGGTDSGTRSDWSAVACEGCRA